ncbi:MAG TPA: hypothetical protein VNZ53_56220 [Steroidobacteraceae bacterium]|jgi:hypothetical protein|nr:hypothetical protein [Steroidobacteraceae bacterium]
MTFPCRVLTFDRAKRDAEIVDRDSVAAYDRACCAFLYACFCGFPEARIQALAQRMYEAKTALTKL